MKKKGTQKKLVLSKETLRALSERDLQGIAGGAPTFVTYCREGCGDTARTCGG
jgi:hypothetical protein